MKLIAELTDRILLGTDGWATAERRYTVRAMVRNPQGLVAVMYAERFGFYSLPGGGIEEGEDALDALRREIMEETGCTCDRVEELGRVDENRAHSNYTQASAYYLVWCDRPGQGSHLTEDEKANGTQVQWHTLEETLRLIEGFRPQTNQQIFLRARDLAALKYYLKQSGKA